MWLLPDQKVLRFAKPVTIDGIQHPKEIFSCWKPEALAAIGIKPYVEVKYNNEFYSRTGEAVAEVDGIVKKTYTTKERYSLMELKAKIDKEIKEQLRLLYERIQKEVAFLTEFDSENLFLMELSQYQNELIEAYAIIQAEIIKITDYVELTEYSWDKHFPSSPFDTGV